MPTKKPAVNDSVLLAAVLWKLKKSGVLPDGINLNTKDLEGFADESEKDIAVLFHHWHRTSVDLKILSKADGEKLAALHVANTGGTATYTTPHEGHKEGG
jgi:hypothetical protein